MTSYLTDNEPFSSDSETDPNTVKGDNHCLSKSYTNILINIKYKDKYLVSFAAALVDCEPIDFVSYYDYQ